MDVLSDILISLKVEATAIATFVLKMPWAIDVVAFEPAYCYSVIEGSCWFIPDDGPARCLTRGECVVGPAGGSFVLAGAPGLPTSASEDIWSANGLPNIRDGTLRQPVTLRWGGNGVQTRLLALAFAFGDGAHRALLKALPGHFYVDAAQSAGIPWLRTALDFLSTEEGVAKPGYSAEARELSTLIFTSLVRTHILGAPQLPQGWLRGLSDPKIALALTAMHSEPGAHWSLATLAARAGMSRATFALRFQSLVGHTPMAYLAKWRMHLAAERLARGPVKVAQLADEFGYRSERAFRTAFKQHIGLTPQALRRRKNLDMPRT